ncbi:MAG: sugar phosphate isomerase/epimerase [Clostridia bacterium]|nr:sugar phosphate isomerase/epimerase [Clostridia bacterium]
MNRIGINYSKDLGLSPEEALPLFSSLCFGAFFTEYDGADASVERFAVLAQENGLIYESLHAPFGHINDLWSDSLEGDDMERELADTVRAASRSGIPFVVLHLSSGDGAPPVCDAGRRRIDRLVSLAVSRRVTLAFENQRKLANLAFVLELYRDCENVGLCWDVGHEKCFAGGREFVPLFPGKLVCTHIHDNDCVPQGDLHMIPFDGRIDFRRTAHHLRGFAGTLMLELFPSFSGRYGAMSPESFVTRARDAVCRLRDMVEEERAN